MMDKIKPHHWITQVGAMYRRKPPKQCKPLAYYDQSAIDALRAEVMQLRELCRDMLPVFEAARPLVLNLERLKEAASGGSR